MTKKVTITLDEDTILVGKDKSKVWMKSLGKDKENLSAYISYLIHKAKK
tara:strand:- start:106 stop:252 length:147 start_codon:yes stop_codon:yes gene_type:complete